MEHEERQIVVWTGQEEKIVCGLTKRTTSADVVQALLDNHKATASNSSFILGDKHREYCIVEKWRGFERILPPYTKIWKLWKAWGKEKVNLTFVLVKADTFLGIPIWRMSEAKVIPSSEKNNLDYCSTHYVKSLPFDKQKRIVKKAFRKLAKIKKEIDFTDANNAETLIHIIVSQDNTIKQQIWRMHEIDKEIEASEAHPHLRKVEDSGMNDVHNCDLKTFDSSTTNCSPKKVFPLEKKTKQKKLELDEQLIYHQKLIDRLSAEIEEEISSLCKKQNGDGIIFSKEGRKKLDEFNLESVKDELEDSLQVGLKLHTMFNSVQKDIKYNDSLLLSKQKEYKHLEEDLKSLSITVETSPLHFTPYLAERDHMVHSSKAKNDFTMKLSSLKTHDTDSDTGISSTHSQD
ncbi:ras association domain-containing protein 9 isoform X2 [Pelobates fuscus]